MYLLGYDIGSSSVKASLIDSNTGKLINSSSYPKQEATIHAPAQGWAEQNPDDWWNYLKQATTELLLAPSLNKNEIQAIGISYQMHGLVLVDKDHKVLRPSIIWCDSRAASIGEKAFNEIGKENCLASLLNSPGNFTASKLKWVKENEPEIYGKIYKMMLPGDYIAMRLTGNIQTTASGLSEGIFWDFENNKTADFLLDYYGFNPELIPETVPTFSIQGTIIPAIALELGLPQGIEVTYRAGDQPNNAFSLNVLQPGEIAATAGTSGVVYGVSDQVKYDPKSRVNTFLHVNNQVNLRRNGILLCINGSGILNSWIHKNIASDISYDEMNHEAAKIIPGSDGLCILPFGNGAERIFENHEKGCSIHNLQFNIHTKAHLFRAAQEGIAFSFYYGMKIMEEMGMKIKTIKAGNANLFLSPIFRETLANLSGADIQLFNTDGSVGAARAAGIGAGIFKNDQEAFIGLSLISETLPNKELYARYQDLYHNWEKYL